MAAQQQPLEQSQAFASGTGQHHLLTVRAVLLQPLLVLKEFFQGDVPFVVLFQADAPVRHSDRVHPFMNLALGADLAAILVTTEDVHPGIRRVLEDTQHPAVRQAPPNNLAIPRSPIGPLGKA